MADETAPKRRRVYQACDSCRSLKSKCDGRKPICSRCQGYGYTCLWRDRRAQNTTRGAAACNEYVPSSDEISTLRQALETSQQLLSRLRGKLDPGDRHMIDAVLGGNEQTTPTSTAGRQELLQLLRRPSISVHRYLGEVSDVSFFNLVKSLVKTNSCGHRADLPLESYEREAAELSSFLEDTYPEFPDRADADAYVDIYFSTIHVAYPFVNRKQFMHEYEQFWSSEGEFNGSLVFKSLLLTIFAIGSCYSICTLTTEQLGPVLHSVYFQRALLVSCYTDTECSRENVGALLAQCFYLLATCQTDRCWMTLGLAIRIGQSLGLHVEDPQSQSDVSTSQIEREFNRRMWHSLYVLDRLLSLQLGRPSAIRNRDCNVKYPSRLDDGEFNTENDTVPESLETQPNANDYFIAVIKFSTIIGHVIRDVYRPCMMDYSKDMLIRTDRLDEELLKWKSQLPRWLRFDRGHTFERSAVLKRQRNMLAIKFHHLRALIHRPYLCLPWLQRNGRKIGPLLESDGHRVVYFERICVKEAQETARMLHDVTDKKTLVEDFPWWQMISCLICASSILLVMRAFTASTKTTEEDLQPEVLQEDADTCLKVFDALSTNSDGARLARDMLQNLRDSKVQDQVLSAEFGTHRSDLGHDQDRDGPLYSNQAESPSVEPDLTLVQDFNNENATMETVIQNDFVSVFNWQDWPSELADSMTWSSQFVDILDPVDLVPKYASHK